MKRLLSKEKGLCIYSPLLTHTKNGKTFHCTRADLEKVIEGEAGFLREKFPGLPQKVAANSPRHGCAQLAKEFILNKVISVDSGSISRILRHRDKKVVAE